MRAPGRYLPRPSRGRSYQAPREYTGRRPRHDGQPRRADLQGCPLLTVQPPRIALAATPRLDSEGLPCPPSRSYLDARFLGAHFGIQVESLAGRLLQRNHCAAWTEHVRRALCGRCRRRCQLLLTDSVSRIVINDLDPAIYCFWHSITYDSDAFLDRLTDTPLTLVEWRRQQEIYRSRDQTDSLAFGFATFYLNRTNRSGVMNAGVVGGQSQDGKYRIDARYDKDSLIKRIQAIAAQRHRIKVTNEDGAAAIRKAFRLKGVLVYADPPTTPGAASSISTASMMPNTRSWPRC